MEVDIGVGEARQLPKQGPKNRLPGGLMLTHTHILGNASKDTYHFAGLSRDKPNRVSFHLLKSMFYLFYWLFYFPLVALKGIDFTTGDLLKTKGEESVFSRGLKQPDVLLKFCCGQGRPPGGVEIAIDLGATLSSRGVGGPERCRGTGAQTRRLFD